MTSLQATPESVRQPDGLRPVNLRTDLGPLADLLELAFASSMDSGGRAAVREMRYLSRSGLGLNMLAGISDLAQGVSMGYVWVADGRLVGNVSTYPAGGTCGLENHWIIANVAVHPDYQRRGIAQRLMEASMDLIHQRGGKRAILQVDADNQVAQRLYRRLGFVGERNWITWRRNIMATRPPPLEHNLHITHRRAGEWRAEYALAQQVFPAEKGGLGWLRPLHPDQFHRPWWRQITDWLGLKSVERLIIRDPQNEDRLLASLWIESAFASSSVHLSLLVHPDYEGLYDDILLNSAVRRFGARQPLMLEHPADLEATSAVLRRYQFSARREVLHMHWDVR